MWRAKLEENASWLVRRMIGVYSLNIPIPENDYTPYGQNYIPNGESSICNLLSA
jgi:hypothetical protein